MLLKIFFFVSLFVFTFCGDFSNNNPFSNSGVKTHPVLMRKIEIPDYREITYVANKIEEAPTKWDGTVGPSDIRRSTTPKYYKGMKYYPCEIDCEQLIKGYKLFHCVRKSYRYYYWGKFSPNQCIDYSKATEEQRKIGMGYCYFNSDCSLNDKNPIYKDVRTNLRIISTRINPHLQRYYNLE
eukprot:EC822221.1.p1 GENE.EC822221.1~~EC822221.1.p1  ORF type:complete len:182 (+),score=43.34 EC822221.1:45-590(+)